MLVPTWMSTNMADGNQQKREFIPRATHKHWSNTFSNTLTVKIAKLPEISHFFNLHDNSLGRHVDTTSRKSLEI